MPPQKTRIETENDANNEGGTDHDDEGIDGASKHGAGSRKDSFDGISEDRDDFPMGDEEPINTQFLSVTPVHKKPTMTTTEE